MHPTHFTTAQGHNSTNKKRAHNTTQEVENGESILCYNYNDSTHKGKDLIYYLIL